MYIFIIERKGYYMARKKTTEYIATELNLDMLDSIVGSLNNIANSLRETYDTSEIYIALRGLHRFSEHGFEKILDHEGHFKFTMVCKALPLPPTRRRKVYEYRFRANTYTNDITCIDEHNNEWAMPLLTDSLEVIREKILQVVG